MSSASGLARQVSARVLKVEEACNNNRSIRKALSTAATGSVRALVLAPRDSKRNSIIRLKVKRRKHILGTHKEAQTVISTLTSRGSRDTGSDPCAISRRQIPTQIFSF
jgi:hypothetical protein